MRFDVNKKKTARSDFLLSDLSFKIEYYNAPRSGSSQRDMALSLLNGLKQKIATKGKVVDSETATLDVSALSSHPFAVSTALSSANQSPPSCVAITRRTRAATRTHQRMPCARPWALRRR